MKLTGELKIIDKKITANQVQYYLSREAAKISVLPSKNLDKYEYLTGEDLGYKPHALKEVKFEKDEVKKISESKSDYNYDSKPTFLNFTEILKNLKSCNH